MKYEAVFGNQKLFDKAPSYAVAVSIIGFFLSELDLLLYRDTPIVAFRKIID